MAAERTPRDVRRRRLGQNFLLPDAAERFVAEVDVASGEMVVDIGAGTGALTGALARRGARVVAVELDPVWARRLRARYARHLRVRVVHADALRWRWPEEPFRVVACPPFGATTAILRRLLDDPDLPLVRADLIIQWEVARKRAASPPTTLLSSTWAPWWQFRLGSRVPATSFRPVPRVDGGVLSALRRDAPLLPPAMAPQYATFVETHWPFRRGEGNGARRRNGRPWA